MPQTLANKVVVITGASSGVGRATALAFARKGAQLVLAARRATLLEELAQQCEQAGSPKAIAMPTDLTDGTAVNALADRALSTFGQIDVWVNNAGAAVFGRFEETPLQDHVQVIQTDLMGTIYGARAALPVFKRQGWGTLINTASLDSKIAEPYMSSYVAAKHAVAGLGASLRQELQLAGANSVHVCTVMPESIDTPFFQHAANYTGRAVRAMPPVVSAERVANTIARLATRPKREVFVGASARLFATQWAMAPGLSERMFAIMGDKLQLSTKESAPQTDGSLFTPMMEGAGISGGWNALTGNQGKGASKVAKVKRAPNAGIVPAGASLMALSALTVGFLVWTALRKG